MNDTATIKIYGGPRSDYELVWFEGPSLWFIRCTERKTGKQSYSSIGYNSKSDAMRAFEGTVTYI